jgi:type IV pilus assembly protein PilW
VSGKTSDALVLMAASSGAANLPVSFTGFATSSSTAATLPLSSTQGLSGSDLLLLVDRQGTGTGAAACMVQQVAAGFTGGSSTTAPLGGSYFADAIGSQSLGALTGDAVAMNLGNIANGNPPQFLLVGVGDHNVLYTYDLLQAATEPLQQRAEGVFELHALYGVDLDGDGKLSSTEWVSPAADAYAPAALAAGTTAANVLLQRIKAVRVGLILRTSLPERAGSAQAPGATSATLFADTAWSFTRPFTGDELNHRYRTLELTIPVRNNLLLN